MKKVAIVGAGFTGLSVAYQLSKKDIDVVIFEKEKLPGGLASGFKKENWKWPLDQHYRHIFTSDNFARDLADEVGQEINFSRPKSSTYSQNDIYQLDSPASLLKFSEISLLSRLRTAVTLFYLKYIASWESLEECTSEKFLKVCMGKQSWKVLWEPLFRKKFGKYSSKISATWFWARIKKRSVSLGYPDGGFHTFIKRLEKSVRQYGGKVHYGSEVQSIKKLGKKFEINVSGKIHKFDKVVCAVATPVFAKIIQGLPQTYKKQLSNLKIIGASNLVLSLNKPFFTDDTYWLNVNEEKYPFVAIVEHTNFVDKKYYGNEHLLYVGNYLESSHENFTKSAGEMFETYYPYLKKINKDFSKSWVNSKHLFSDPYAQPIYTTNYSKNILDLETPIEDLYLVNMQQVYPWDRGVNYAIELGAAVATLVLQSD